jgi:RNA polymerase primary sigma factor
MKKTTSKKTRRSQPVKPVSRHALEKKPRQRPATARPAPPRRDPPPATSAANGTEASESLRGDCLQLYLREISQVKLLTAPEVTALAKRIKRGDRQAREHLIRANLRLVVKIARSYEGMGLPLLDLINEGNLGLMKGIKRFDPTKGKISTYASWWIKQGIKRALANQSKTIRLPVHIVDRLLQIRRADARLHETLGREPTDEEIAAELDLDPRRIRQCRDAARTPVSLDSPIGADDSLTIAEVIPDPDAVAPLDRLINNTDRALLREVLATLRSREGKILAMRYGLDNGEPKSLEIIGQHFGVTRERIRQIQEKALQQLRTKIKRRERNGNGSH